MNRKLTSTEIKCVMANYYLFASTFGRMSKELYKEARELYTGALNAFGSIGFAFDRVVRFVECH